MPQGVASTVAHLPIPSDSHSAFRGDLDAAKQRAIVAAYHHAASDESNYFEWKKTMLHRKDHYAMVMMLFGEAVRHNPTRFTNAEKKDIVGKLKLMMGEGQRRDCYVDALHYLCSLNMFEGNPTLGSGTLTLARTL